MTNAIGKDSDILIGREDELRTLRDAASSGRPEFIAVYGRRRVGKTFLVRKALGDRFVFSHAGLSRTGMKGQLAAFAESMSASFGKPFSVPTSWLGAFSALRKELERKRGRKILFLDELPWMDTPCSRFLPALEYFWNGWASGRSDIVLVACGSATSWIVRKIIDDYGGLHDRLTHRIQLFPFSLHECREYCRAAGLPLEDGQIADLFLTFGGVPFYWSLLRKGESPAKSVDRLLFSPRGELKGEFGRLYASLFRNPARHLDVIRALGTRRAGLTQEELLSATGSRNNGAFSRTLEDLESCGFVRRYRFPGKVERDSTWQLIDPFTLFHLRFLADTANRAEGNWLAGSESQARTTWRGLAFEQLCLLHVPQIKKALGISGVSASVYACRIPADNDGNPGAQIDLVLDRADGIVNLCEMKYTIEPFSISSKYRTELAEKIAAYRRTFETKKAIHVTVVSANGLKENANADIVQSMVNLADLFEKP